MAVRKREWVTRKGEQKATWVVDYRDRNGTRRLETHRTKKAADARAAQVAVDLGAGIHTARGASITVSQAAENWITHCEGNGRERSTVVQYKGHVKNYIGPHLGRIRLCDLTGPEVVRFDQNLLKAQTSTAMRRKHIVSLSSLLKRAMFEGRVTRNVAAGYRTGADKRARRKKEVGVDIPTKEEIQAFTAVLEGRWWPFFTTVVYTGMRSSELRGLRWVDVDWKGRRIHVRQRADLYNQIGRPKSESGTRTIFIGGLLVHVLSEWRNVCPASELGLVFPTSKGGIQSLREIRLRGLIPLMERAGVTKKDGTAKYSGLHAFRHFHAAYLLTPKTRGGRGMNFKEVQQRLGHSTIGVTMDTYGHLLPEGENTTQWDDAERELMAT